MPLLYGAGDALECIPTALWGDALSDSRILTFDEWCDVYLHTIPARVDRTAFIAQAQAIYDVGPLLYFQATHVN